MGGVISLQSWHLGNWQAYCYCHQQQYLDLKLRPRAPRHSFNEISMATNL